MKIDNLALAAMCRDPEQWSDIEPKERQYIADTLEQVASIPKLAYHVIALRALLAINAMQMQKAGRDTTAFDKQLADINNILATVQDIPEVHELLFPKEPPLMDAAIVGLAGKPGES
ncbi:MAG TPA: hypothetical protein VLA34_06600 [Candidatus Krumholzibacterium sp.]|nr:hypothetical protein [Candidatus Krumholzibacterium sp.]